MTAGFCVSGYPRVPPSARCDCSAYDERAPVARPEFGVRGSYRSNTTNFKDTAAPRIWKRELKQEPQTSKADALRAL